MRNIVSNIFILLCCVFLFSCNHQVNKHTSNFELSGTLSGGGTGISIYLDRLSPDGLEHLDSTKIDTGGTFTFRTPGIIKGFYKLRITKQDFAMLILDSTEKVHVEGNSQNLGYTYTTTGSADSKQFGIFNRASVEYETTMDSIKEKVQVVANSIGNDKKRLDSLNSAIEGPYDSLQARHERFVTSFIKGNLTSFASLAAIQELSPDQYLSYFVSLDSGLIRTYPNSVYTKHFHDEVTAFRRVAIGAPAPELSLTDTSGKIVSLSSFKGKVVLIDFWASWCQPCNSILPGEVKIYNEFKDKDFTILGVSLDRDKGAWLDAIHKFHLKWTQVSDLKFKDSKVFELYNFSRPPFNVLVSADGKILDKNLNVGDMETELKKLFSSPKITH